MYGDTGRQLATQKAAVKTAGYDSGAGFIKLPYDKDLPTKLLRSMMKARLAAYNKTGD